MKLINRLMFVQGNRCFFCNLPLPKGDASVEHLLAAGKGGSNARENCVVCCKSLNELFGDMSVKEKFQVILNRNGKFTCPNGNGDVAVSAPATKPIVSEADDDLERVVANLKKRGDKRPRTPEALRKTIISILPKGACDNRVAAVVENLER